MKRKVLIVLMAIMLSATLVGCAKKDTITTSNKQYPKCCRAHSGCGKCIERSED